MSDSSPNPSVFSASFGLYRVQGLLSPSELFFSSPLISLSIKSLPTANVINLDPKPDAEQNFWQGTLYQKTLQMKYAFPLGIILQFNLI